MTTPDACAPTPPPSPRPPPDSLSPWPPQWKRSEALDLVHPVDDVVAVLRRIRLVEGGRPMGVQASVCYEVALDLVSQLHELVRLLEPPSRRSG